MAQVSRFILVCLLSALVLSQEDTTDTDASEEFQDDSRDEVNEENSIISPEKFAEDTEQELKQFDIYKTQFQDSDKSKDLLNLCNWEKWRLAQYLFESEIEPILDEKEFTVTERCPFHPSRNFMKVVEENYNKKVDNYSPKCAVCQKQFKTSKYWSWHVSRHHYNELEEKKSQTASCTADYCEVLHCDKVDLKTFYRGSKSSDKLTSEDFTSLDPKTRRNRCRKLFKICLNDGSELGHELELYFTKKLCLDDEFKATAREEIKMAKVKSILTYLAMFVVIALVLVYYFLVFTGGSIEEFLVLFSFSSYLPQKREATSERKKERQREDHIQLKMDSAKYD